MRHCWYLLIEEVVRNNDILFHCLQYNTKYLVDYNRCKKIAATNIFPDQKTVAKYLKRTERFLLLDLIEVYVCYMGAYNKKSAGNCTFIVNCNCQNNYSGLSVLPVLNVL